MTENLTDKPQNVSEVFCVRCRNYTRAVIMVDNEPHCGDCLSIILEDLQAENRRLEGRLRLSAVEKEKLMMDVTAANEKTFEIMKQQKKLLAEIGKRIEKVEAENKKLKEEKND